MSQAKVASDTWISRPYLSQFESVLEEYCDNAQRIERIRVMDVKRGSWSGKIDTYHANENWLAAMMLTARQLTIIQLLHGKLDTGGEFVEQDQAAITTIGEYGDDMFYCGFVKGEGIYFRV